MEAPDIFSVESMMELVATVKAMPNPIAPLRLDDGRSVYLTYDDRRRMIDRLPPGMTWAASSSGDIAIFEPVQIETMQPLAHGCGAYFYG